MDSTTEQPAGLVAELERLHEARLTPEIIAKLEAGTDLTDAELQHTIRYLGLSDLLVSNAS